MNVAPLDQLRSAHNHLHFPCDIDSAVGRTTFIKFGSGLICAVAFLPTGLGQLVNS